MANQQQQENARLQEAKKLIQDINSLRVQMSQEPLSLADSEAVRNIQSLRNEFKQLARDIGDVDNSATNLFDQMVGIAKEFGAINTPANQLKSAFKGLVAEAAKMKNDELGLLDLRTRDLETIQKKLGLQNEAARVAASQFEGQRTAFNAANTAKEQQVVHQSRINQLTEEMNKLGRKNDAAGALSTLKEIERVQASLAAVTQERIEHEAGVTEGAAAAFAYLDDSNSAYNKINNKVTERLGVERKVSELTGVTGALVGGTGALMERLGMRSGIFHDAMKDSAEQMRKMAKSTAEGGEKFSKLQIAAKGFSVLAQGFGKAFNDPASAALAIVTAFFEVNKAQTEFIQLTGQSAASLGGVNTQVASMTDLLKTAAEFTKQTGLNAAAIFTPQQIGQIADATQLLGVSAEQARTLGMVMKQTGKSADDIGNAIYDNVDAGISNKVVYDDVLSASDDIVASSGGNVEALGRAASAARKLGMDLTKVNQIADGLMNFEDSIGNELEAQLITGKNINLSKARELALNNDLEGVAKELEKNGASAAEYAGMNRIQQESMAKAMGMNRAELGKMVLTQEAMANMTADQIAAARGVTLEQSKQMDVQAKIKKSMDRLAQAFAPILEAVVPIVDILLNIIRPIAAIVGWALKWKAVTVALSIALAAFAGYSLFTSIKAGIVTIQGYAAAVAGTTTAQVANTTATAANTAAGTQNVALTKMQSLYGRIYNKIEHIGTIIKDKKVMATLREKAAIIQSTVAEKFSNISKKISNLLGMAGNKITLKSTLLTLRNAAAFVLKTAATVAMVPIMLAWNAIKSLGTFLLGSNTVATISNTVATTAGTAATTASGAATGIWNSIKNLQILAVLRSAGAWALEKLGMIASTVATYASMAAQAAWTGIKNLQLLSMARSAAFWVAEKVRMGVDTVMRWLNIGALGAQATASGALAGSQTAMAASAGPAAGGLAAMGAALGAFGVAAAPAIPIILAIGAALLLASPAIYAIGTIITGLAKVIGDVLMKALEMIPPIIGAIADGFVTIFTAVSENIGSLLLMGPALAGIGLGLIPVSIGLGLLAAAGILLGSAAPLILMGSVAVAALGLALQVVSPAIDTVATGFATMMGALSTENIGALMLLGPALLLASVGMIAFSTAMLVGGLGSFFGGGIIDDITELAMIGPQLAMAGEGLASITTNLSEISGAVATLSQSLSAMGSVVAPLYGVAGGLISIAAGLGMVAMAGIAAIPALAALSTFAIIVTPLASIVGDLFGGEGGGGEDKSMAEISTKLDTLITLVGAGGDVFLDGTKVGEALMIGAVKSS